MHDGCHGTAKDRCRTHHTPHTFEGSDDVHANLNRDPFISEQQRFARFVPSRGQRYDPYA